MAGRGTFVAQISAANMTIPIEGASVTVAEANMQVPQAHILSGNRYERKNRSHRL